MLQYFIPNSIMGFPSAGTQPISLSWVECESLQHSDASIPQETAEAVWRKGKF